MSTSAVQRLTFYLAVIGFGLLCVIAPRWFTIQAPPPPVVHRPSIEIRPTPERQFVDVSQAAEKVPVLMYHYIRSCTDPNDVNCSALSVTPENFGKQLAWFQEHGYVSVDLDYFSKPYAVVGKPFIITFDDGYQDTYDDALPLLEKYGFTATWYIISDRIGESGYLTWDEVNDMYRRVMTIGSHTLDHRDMTSLLTTDVVREVTVSKRVIEQHLQARIADFCYPYGRHNILAEEAVQQAGYRSATTTKEGIATFSDAAMRLPRIRMKDNTVLDKALSLVLTKT